MNISSKLKSALLVFGDATILYFALIITLLFRYKNLFYSQFFNNHLGPFSIIFFFWILVFYVVGLYDLKFLKNNFEFKKMFLNAGLFNAFLAAIFFYTLPYFRITPRANLIIIMIIFGTLDYLWRKNFNKIIAKSDATNKILLIGQNESVSELLSTIEKNPQLGYEIKYWLKEGLMDKEFSHIEQIIKSNDINTVIIPSHIKKNRDSAKLIYKIIISGIEVLEVSNLYEIIFRKVALAEMEESWFLQNLSHDKKIYELIMAPIEIIAAFLLLIGLSPLILLIAGLIKLTSKGPIIFKQVRTGKREKEFMIYKFRTMSIDAEKNGPQWADYHKDTRATWFGSLLRKAHVDELPQLINVIKGEISFVGPRPERPEFVAKLKSELPYYDLRHLIKPGITGWAQINYRYAASTLDSYQKLQYDIYYIKNHSLFLDAVIIIKTLKFFITNH